MSGSRQTGYTSLQRLIFSEIVSYMNERGYVGEDRDIFLERVQFMDHVLMEELDKKKPKK